VKRGALAISSVLVILLALLAIPAGADVVPVAPVTSADSTDPSIPIDPVEPTDSSASTGPTTSAAATPTAPTPGTTRPGTTSSAHGPLTVTIDFDDGTADQYQTGALLKAHAMPGVYFVNSGRLGLTSEYMSAAQVTSLQAAGNEIGGHTVFHLHLPQQSPAEQQRQICTDRDQLLAQGLRVTDLAFPFGEFTAATQSIAQHCGYDAVRTTEDGNGNVDTLPPANPYQLSALSSLGSDTTAQDIIGEVTKAEKQGGLVQVFFHRVCTLAPCRSNAIRISVFTQVLDWLAAQRKAGALRVTTLARAVGGPVRATVAAPPPTATLGVPNASFEGGSSVPDTPTCWEHTVSGDGNTATWSLVHDAHSGAWAEHVDAPHVAGGIGLVVTQDEGSCASPAVAGDRYTYSVWYESDAPVALVSYRRLAAGGYVPIALSTPFPASPGQWSFATTQTNPLAAGTTGISIGVVMKASGHFTFDDFTLADAGPAPVAVPAAVIAPDSSTPCATARAVPIVAAAHTTHETHHAGRAGWYILGALLLAAAVLLALVDRRLARIRRHA
jgi:peptidoglycan/xylan/chitin deacetylase (PgdA/CDA1 family)